MSQCGLESERGGRGFRERGVEILLDTSKKTIGFGSAIFVSVIFDCF